MPEFRIGIHTYSVSLDRSRYYVRGIPLPAAVNLDTVNTIKSYDQILHQSLDKIFRDRCLGSSEQFKQFLRVPQHNTDYNSVIKPILEQEPFLSEHFSKEELGKLSLLWIAVLGCYVKSAELLVRSGADVNELFGHHDSQVIDEKSTILHLLLKMEPFPENERLIRLVIDHGADLQVRDHLGRTALHYAVDGDRVQMTEMLLENGADVNAVDNDGVTPLLFAARRIPRADVLMPLLIKHGADIFAKDRHRIGIGENFSEYTPIHEAAKYGRNDLVKLYLDRGVNVNGQNESGESPLYLAAESANKTVVKTLLERGANIDLRTFEGRTALHAAFHAACKESARVALLRIHSPEYVENNSIVNITDIIELLLSAGADVLAEDCDGNTPFALISLGENGEPPGTKLLIKKLALKKALQPSIELKDERIIERQPTLWNYYRECVDEIDRIKSRRCEICTLFELLTESYCRIAALMRNPNFEIKFGQCDLNEFPIYRENIFGAFERAKKHYQAMLEQINVINETVYYTLPDLVVDKVVHYVFNCCENVK